MINDKIMRKLITNKEVGSQIDHKVNNNMIKKQNKHNMVQKVFNPHA